MGGQHLFGSLARHGANVQRTGLLPLRRRAPVCQLGVDKIARHAGQRIGLPQKMALASDGFPNVVQHQCGRPHLDRCQSLQDGTQHVVVNHIRLQRGRHQTGLHAAGLRDEVATRLRGQRDIECFLVTRLRIRNLAVSSAGNGGVGQVEVPGHLHTGSRQGGLFSATAGHAAGAQVGHHGARAKNQACLRVNQPAEHHAGECFGNGLRHTAGNGDGAGRAHLPEGVDHGRYAHFHRHEQDLAGVRVKAQWRHGVVDVE